jgi:hypothetical protein
MKLPNFFPEWLYDYIGTSNAGTVGLVSPHAFWHLAL